MSISTKKRAICRVMAVIMATILMLTTVVGCKDDASGIESEIIRDDSGSLQNTPSSELLEDNRSWDVPNSDYQETDITLTLATFHSRDLRDAVVKFNEANPNCHIEVIDYAQFNTENNLVAGLMKLSTDIISGKVPDILDVSYLPYETYASKGLFTDLYPYIDSDAELNRNDFVEGVFKAAEINGKLYQVFPSFSIYTIIGHPSIVGSGVGWNIDEFKSVLAAHPEADMPIGNWLSKSSFLKAAITFDFDKYINWEAGTVHFDTKDFIQLLEYANTFPDEIDWWDVSASERDFVFLNPNETIPAGRQILLQTELSDYWSYQWNKALFGGEIVFKGFPTEYGNGSSLSVNGGLAITEDSLYKDAAWAFVRTILDKDWQLNNEWSRSGFMTNKAAFDHIAEEAQYFNHNQDTGSISVENLTKADVEIVLSLIGRTTVITSRGISDDGWGVDRDIWNIISEGAMDYFRGAATAQDAARIMQSRLSILVSERS